MSQGGNVGRLNYKTGERWFIKPPVIDTERINSVLTGMLPLHKIRLITVLFITAASMCIKARNKGASWQTISPDLTTNNPEQQKQDENGGLTLDITGAENYTYHY